MKNIVWMGKNMLQDVNVFVKIHKKEEILNSIIVCIRYIHMAFSMNMGIDTEVMITGDARILRQWVELGRQGLFFSTCYFSSGMGVIVKLSEVG